MDITSVKNTTDGYIVNSQFFIPQDEDNLDYQDILQWVSDGGVIEEEFSQEEILEKAKDKKRSEINTLKEKLMNLNSPHTVGATYTLSLNGENVRFQVNEKARAAIMAIILDMDGDESVTEEWVAVDNKIYQLSLADFKALNKHLKDRATALTKNAREAKDAIAAMTSIEEVEAYDINEIAIY